MVQAWGEETFAVLERLCRSGLFSLLCCVSMPSECLRPALSSTSYRLTPPWHLQKKREEDDISASQCTVLSPTRWCPASIAAATTTSWHSVAGNIQDGRCVICFHINAYGDCSSGGQRSIRSHLDVQLDNHCLLPFLNTHCWCFFTVSRKAPTVCL